MDAPVPVASAINANEASDLDRRLRDGLVVNAGVEVVAEVAKPVVVADVIIVAIMFFACLMTLL